MSFTDGALVAEVVNRGNWGSANSPYISGLSTDKLEAGSWYVFKMDIKGTKPRRIAIRAGLELWDSPWMEDFGIREPKYWIDTEWTTIYYIFYVHAAQSSDGSKNIKFEIHLGAIDYSDNENGNTIMIDNAQFYKLTNYNEAPVITLVSGKATTFIKGTEMPDFKTYFTATDLEDGEYEITDDMIDIGDLDMNVPGTYEITFTVTDSRRIDYKIDFRQCHRRSRHDRTGYYNCSGSRCLDRKYDANQTRYQFDGRFNSTCRLHHHYRQCRRPYSFRTEHD